MNIFSRPSPNFEPRKQEGPISFLIFHFTETKNLEDALAILTSKARNVSAHYVIDADGTIFNLVEPHLRAYHAGESFWENLERLNDFSIGIELVNDGISNFPEPQTSALISLSKKLMAEFPIVQHHILAHSDIAPTRKIDPGALFPWEHLSRQGIGLYPKGAAPAIPMPQNPEAFALACLKDIGYATNRAPLEKLTLAFKLHFMQSDQTPDLTPQTLACMAQVAGLYLKCCK